MDKNLFYAKVLLFGEYAITANSKALSMPYPFYKGKLVKNAKNFNDFQKKSHLSIKNFANYLEKLQTPLVKFDIIAMRSDLEKGMYFDSDIPQGYGIGSSGALVAAFYENYALDKIKNKDISSQEILHLKEIFALMESFFHGKSSGLDPLNSYLEQPILVHSQKLLEPKKILKNKKNEGVIFLLDSELVGHTNSMINIFMNKMKDLGFRTVFYEKFIKHTESCVEHFLKGEVRALFSEVKELSKTALHHFGQMIPETFHYLWQKGIDTNAYYLKLCGSGGGGYIMGFTKDFEKTKQLLKNYRLELVCQF